MSKSKNEHDQHTKKPKAEKRQNVNKKNEELHAEPILDLVKEQEHKEGLILKFDFSQIHLSITDTTDKHQSLIIEKLLNKNIEIDHKFDVVIDSEIHEKKTRSKEPKTERPRSLPLSLSIWGGHSKSNNTLHKSQSAAEIENKGSFSITNK